MTKTPKPGWTDRGVEFPSPKIDLGAFIGRFQFFHLDHLDAINQALRYVRFLVILVGSSNQPRSYFNPFSFEEREAMILASLSDEARERVLCLPLEDSTYNNLAWIKDVQGQVEEARQHFELPMKCRIGLVGHKKDGSSFYLNMFPLWEEVAIRNNSGLSATPLREQFFLTEEPLDDTKLPKPVIDFLERFEEDHPKDYERIRDEYVHVQEYQAPYKDLPFPPIFVTVDACVIQAGNVLLVKRKQMPGRGQWAMPGGFLESTERIEDAIYRELIEETAIDVSEGILRGRTETIRVFDSVHRSSRGRSITHAALIALQTPNRKSGTRVRLPKVKGQKEETENCKWWPLSGPDAITPEMMFEDHLSIIRNLTADL